MSNSNAKIRRKEHADFVEDEIFTINTEIENFVESLSNIDRKKLIKTRPETLAYTRQIIQQLKRDIIRLNQRIVLINKGELN